MKHLRFCLFLFICSSGLTLTAQTSLFGSPEINPLLAPFSSGYLYHAPAKVPYFKNWNTSGPVNPIEVILEKYPQYFDHLIKLPRKHHVQIIYTRIDRDTANKPTLTTYTYRLNRNEFFYAASLVKLPVCALGLEKMNELKKAGITANTTMLSDSAFTCQYSTLSDEFSSTGYPSVANYIRRMLLVSDNAAYSRMYEFLGPEYINKKLWAKGYSTARIRIRFDVNCLGVPNNCTNPVRFLDSSGKEIYKQPMKTFPALNLSMPTGNTVRLIDLGAMPGHNAIRKDFTHSNFLCLGDVHDILKNIMFPEQAPVAKKFNITAEDHRFLWKYLQMMPYESDYPKYADRNVFIDSYKKFLYYGQDSPVIENTNIRIFNILGESYGYTTDCAYIVDFEHHVEFMLSATYFIVEPNGTIDGSEYSTSQFIMPFFAHLGQVFLQEEIKRKRVHVPDLSRYDFR